MAGGQGYSWFELEVVSTYVPVYVEHGKLVVEVQEGRLQVYEPLTKATVRVVVGGITPQVQVDLVEARHVAEVPSVLYGVEVTPAEELWLKMADPESSHLQVLPDERLYTVLVPEDMNSTVQVSDVARPSVTVIEPSPLLVQIDEE